ncbi:hypothetical protein MP228_001353 [Amoeboaphelidium protococcarum]|nr:hypothetical protein MP228_001353 [Amoeboaphelidium protococcarum]
MLVGDDSEDRLLPIKRVRKAGVDDESDFEINLNNLVNQDDIWLQQQKGHFVVLYSSLNCDSESQRLSTQLAHTYLRLQLNSGQSFNVQQVKNMCAACIWIVDIVHARYTGLSINQILKASSTSFEQFGQDVGDIARSDAIISEEEKGKISASLERIKVDYNACQFALNVLKQWFHIFLNFNVNSSQPEKVPLFARNVFQFTWTLILYTKLSLVKDQVNSENIAYLILCCFRFVCNSIPLDFISTLERVQQYDNQFSDFDSQCRWTQFEPQVLAILAKKLNVSYSDVKQQEAAFIQLLHNDFVSSKVWQYETIVTHQDTRGKYLFKLISFIEQNKFLLNLDALSRQYEMLFRSTSGQFDGLLWLQSSGADGQKLQINAPQKLATPAVISKREAPRCLKSKLAHASALEMSMLSTPLTARHMKVKTGDTIENSCILQRFSQMQVIYAKSNEHGMPLDFYRSLPQEYSHRVSALYNDVIQQITLADVQNEPQWKLAVTISFYVLDSIMLAERAKSGKIVNFQSLLHNSDWLKSILACSLETVRFIKSISSLSLQHIMKSLKLQPYSLCIGIEYFIRYSTKMLNWNVIKHFKTLEERILEQELWQHEQPLYTELQAELRHTTSAVSPLTSPRKALKFIVEKPKDHHDQSESCQSNHSVSPLELIHRKLFRLIDTRLYALCAELKITDNLIKKMWSVCAEVVLREYEWRLLFKRHVDLIVMCCIFGVLRATKSSTHMQEVSFSKIIEVYTKQPQFSTRAYCEVYLNGKTTNIVEFYNLMFRETLKEIMGKFMVDDSAHHHPQPLMSPRRSQCSLPRSFTAQQSPLDLLSPRSKRLSCDPREALAFKQAGVSDNAICSSEVKKPRKLHFSKSGLSKSANTFIHQKEQPQRKI